MELGAEARIGQRRRVAVAVRFAVVPDRNGKARAALARVGEGAGGVVAGGAGLRVVPGQRGVKEQPLAQRSKAGRVGRAAEYGDLVAFLCSARAAYVTGTAVNLDGGLCPVL